MVLSHRKEHTFYGTTTLGEKGQLVVPAEARAAMKIAKGEKLLVFGMGHDMIALAKLSEMEQFASHLSEKLKTIKKIISKNKN